MEIIEHGEMPDGRTYEIVRIVTPDPEVPEEVVRYFIASFGFDKYRVAVYGLALWRSYFRDSLAGVYAPEVIDHHYIMKIGGRYAGRLWFGYNTRTGRGNFGNVYTETEFRHQGVMGVLLRRFRLDFDASPATMLCCESGNPYAVPSYLKTGFQLIYGGKGGPLALCKAGTFADAEARLFPGGDAVTRRPGGIGDQFECDKILAYSQGVFRHPRQNRCGLSVLLGYYQTAYQETLSGNGIVNVLENSVGAVPGYAFAVNFFGEPVLDFRFHPAYAGEMPALVRMTADRFAETYGVSPVCTVREGDTERAKIAADGGLKAVGGLKEQYQLFR